MKTGKILTALLISVACIAAALAGALQSVDASAVDELTIKIGYYGWSPSDYVEKAVFSASDLYDMGCVTSDYTYWDGSKRVAIDSSMGVPLSTVLDAAGIDQSSIANLDFWTADSGGGAFTSFTWQQLLGTKRYYFNNLPAYFSIDEDGNVVCDVDGAWKEARRVSPMMALEENWTWYEIGTEDAAGTDNYGTANRFRLNFGQTDPMERRTFNSAKMVHTIYVMFSGAPVLTSDETNIDGKVGSTHQLKVTAAAADEALEGVVQGNVVWSSSDSSIVEVDENGNLTFKNKGTAVITATSGDTVFEFNIKVGDEEKKSDTSDNTVSNTANGTGNGNGNGNGDGNGTGTGKGNGGISRSSDKKTGTNTKPAAPVQKTKITETKPKTFVLSDSASKRLKSAFSKTASADEASMSTHQQEMDKDTEQFEVQKDSNSLAGTMGLINGILVIEGGIFGYLSYRKQRWG